MCACPKNRRIVVTCVCRSTILCLLCGLAGLAISPELTLNLSVYRDTEANQSSSSAISPISTQDLIPGASQDMPVSSTAFPWTSTAAGDQQQQHSLTSLSSAPRGGGVESSAGQGGGGGGGVNHTSLTEWTHFANIPSDVSDDRDNILKQLLKDSPDSEANDNGPHALLRQILSGKPGE